MDKKFLGSLFAIGFAFQAFCQNPNAEKYGGLITTSSARKHLTIIASDAFEGRETGKPGAERAAAYIATEFRKLGLKAPVNNSYFQRVPLLEHKLEVKMFSANKRVFRNGHDFYFSNNPASKTVQAKEIVFVGYGISDSKYDDLKNVDIANKVVVLVTHGEPVKNGVSLVSGTTQKSDWETNPSKRLDNVLSKAPSMILAVSPDVESILKEYSKHFTDGKVALKGKPQPVKSAIPIAHITPALANILLKNAGKSYEALTSEINQTGIPKSQAVPAQFQASLNARSLELKASNVLGYLEGSDLKDEVVVISAHYDHVGLNPGGPDKVFNGADDDGSGTTAILEIAKAYTKAKKEGHGPRRSVLFLGNVGEEKGLLGSEYYSDNPVFPLEKTITNLNIDMIGRIDPAHKADTNYCYLVGSDRLSMELHNISEKANATYTKFKLDYKYNDVNDPERIYYRSDHYHFAKHNIPVIFYFNGIHEDYHQPGDEVHKIDFNLLVRRAQLVFYTSWDLVNRDKRPPVHVGSGDLTVN